MKIHVITLSHKHGEDIVLTKDAPTELQLKEMKSVYEKAHDIEIYGAHYTFYEDTNHMMNTKETIHRLRNMA